MIKQIRKAVALGVRIGRFSKKNDFEKFMKD